MPYYMFIALYISWNRRKVKVKFCINKKQSVQIQMETKETYLSLCPNGVWLRDLLRQITRNTTMECQVIDYCFCKGEGGSYCIHYYSFY